MLNFVTLFDRNYLSRGLALYDSLEKECNDSFLLFILCMDEESYLYFSEKKMKNISLIKLDEIEAFYPVLLKLKQERSRGEYCWTLTPFSIQYILKTTNISMCTYLDADLYFFNSPKCLLDELPNDKSVLITEHNYTPCYDQSLTSGKYCVQFMVFKNDLNGGDVLEWWRHQCELWCYNRMEGGKFGDQKYLDDWTTRFTSVYVSKNEGAGVAPWNMQKFDIFRLSEEFFIRNTITKKESKVVFVHFHNLKPINNTKWHVGDYSISEDFKFLVYKPYIRKILEIEQFLSENLKSKIMVKYKSVFWNLLFATKIALGRYIKDIYKILKGNYCVNLTKDTK